MQKEILEQFVVNGSDQLQKPDLLVTEQMKTLFDIQKQQINVMEDIRAAIKNDMNR